MATGYRTTEEGDIQRRVRLSEWAREEGIARITAYRMLRRGILPVPTERSPTGRWYVLLPQKQARRIAFYARASPGPHVADALNEQIFALAEWADEHREQAFVVVREVAEPYSAPMPRLAQLLADRHISDIVIDCEAVVGESKYALLVAALAPQGRRFVLAKRKRGRSKVSDPDVRAAIENLCKSMYGVEKGVQAARRAIDFGART